MKTKKTSILPVLICFAAIVLMTGSHAAAESAADFYKGKTVKMMLGFAAGNTTDATARLVAPYLAKKIGADVMVVNKPGGGGLVARNEFYALTEPDGLTIMSDPSLALWPGWLLNQKGVAYDITKFIYLGGIKSSLEVLVVKSDGPYQSIEDMKNSKETIRLAVSGVAQLPAISCLTAVDVLDLNAVVVPGYKNSRAYVTAVVQGEAHGACAGLQSAIRYIGGGMPLKMLVYNWYERDSEAPDLPSLNEFAKIPDNAMTMMKSLPTDAKTFFAAPNTPKDRVQYLRDSVAAILADPAFQKEMIKLVKSWGGAISGEELQEIAGNMAKDKSASVAYYNTLLKKYIK